MNRRELLAKDISSFAPRFAAIGDIRCPLKAGAIRGWIGLLPGPRFDYDASEA